MKKNFPILALVLGATLFAAGVVYLFMLRFEAGDVYPPYSSLRADPLGTMALAESLAKLPGLEVRRDVSTTSKLPEEKNTTYLHLAAETSDWRWMPADLFKEIEAFATRGGRLVVTMRPVHGPDFWSGTSRPFPITTTNAPATNAPGMKGGKKGLKKKSIPGDEVALNYVSLQKRWGVEFAHLKLKAGDNDVYEPAEVVNQTDLPLPPGLDWHSALVLTNLAPSWRTIYSRGKSPVVVERKFGRGSVVIATDSYFLSNEALWKAREPRLLAWLIGPGAHVVFDEAHLGVTESESVAVLMRKYRLHGVIGGLLLLAFLFIWKNSFSLVPPHADLARSDHVAGKDATAGYVNLLRRNIAPREILNVCFNEWTKSLLQRGNFRIASVDQAQAVMDAERALPPGARNPVRAYQEICRVLGPGVPGRARSAMRQAPSAINDHTNS
jgi:hypothetical protein